MYVKQSITHSRTELAVVILDTVENVESLKATKFAILMSQKTAYGNPFKKVAKNINAKCAIAAQTQKQTSCVITGKIIIFLQIHGIINRLK